MQILVHICLETFRNSYIIASPETREAIIIDPAGIDTRLIELIENNRYQLKGILLTSQRNIHDRPVRTLRKIYPVDVYCIHGESKDVPVIPIQPDQTLSLLGFAILPVSMSSFGMNTVAYSIGECLFSGDVLSAGLIGEPTSSFAMALLKTEIQEKLLTLPANTMVFPAHGPPSTIEAETRTNPYLQEQHDPVADDRAR